MALKNKMKLSERLACFRNDRPSCETMDVFIKHAAELETESEIWKDVAERNLKAWQKLQAQVDRYETALKSIVGQTDDQFVDGVWREINSTAKQALQDKP